VFAAFHFLERGFDRRGATGSRHASHFELDLFGRFCMNHEL
jgi:hypothetical protein